MSAHPRRPILTPAERDDQVQADVLARLVDWLPAHLTKDEIVCELVGNPGEFGARDEIERALRDLVRAGLAHRYGLFVIPSRAALRYAELANA